MELVHSQVFKSLKLFWQRRKYDRLESSSARKKKKTQGVVVKLAINGSNRQPSRRAWKMIKMVRCVFPIKARSSPFMKSCGQEMGTLDIHKNFEKVMMVHIYNNILSPMDQEMVINKRQEEGRRT